MRKRIRLEHVPEFKYLGCVYDESGTDEVGTRRVGGFAGPIRSLVNARSLQLECAKAFFLGLGH